MRSMSNIVLIAVRVRVGVIPKDCPTPLKLIVGGADAGVNDVGGVPVLGIATAVVDVICRVGGSVGDTTQPPGGVFLGGEACLARAGLGGEVVG